MAGLMRKLKSLILPRADPEPTNNNLGEVPENIQEQMNNILNAVSHVRACGSFPCDTCIRAMVLVKEISGNSSLDQQTIGDLMAERAGFCTMVSSTWARQHLLDLFSSSAAKDTNRAERAFTFYRALAGTCWNYSDESDAFCRKLHEEDSLKMLVDWMLIVGEIDDLNRWATEIVFNVMNVLHNVCRRLPDIGRMYHRAVPALQKLGESADAITQACAFMTLSYLVKKDEADKISINASCVDKLLSLLGESMENIEHRIRITRETGTDAFRRGYTLSSVELVQAVDQLAINDNNKRLIAEKGGIGFLGRMLEIDCSTEEKTHAAGGLWRLAFLKENKETLRQDQSIMRDLIQLSSGDKPALRAACMGAIFEIYDSKLPEEVTRSTEPEEVPGSTEPEDTSTAESSEERETRPSSHIMISYRWENPSKIVMREFKDQLKARGYNVWMDEDFMGGDMIEAMARAVENADVILACITQGYQESKNCRTEASYAYDCNKKIVPVKVNDRFRATGWLGGITAGKIYYVVKSIEDVVRELPRIIDLEIEGKTQDQAATHTEEPVEPKAAAPNHSEATDWDVGKVREWLKANKISNKRLRNFDGTKLVQLKKHLDSARDNFFQCMKEDMKMSYTDVLSLAAALEKLD